MILNLKILLQKSKFFINPQIPTFIPPSMSCENIEDEKGLIQSYMFLIYYRIISINKL